MKRLFRPVGLLGSLLLILTLAVPIQAAPPMQSPVCDYYVDNAASSDGDGSWDHPWNDINDHVGDLLPGETMCVRGDVAGPGRVYEMDQIILDSEYGIVRDGAPGSPITVRPYPDERVILKNVGSDSLIYFRSVDYWIFEGFTMDHNRRGMRAIRFTDGANYNILRNNEIYNGRGDLIAFHAGHNVGNVIENNHIHHFDGGHNQGSCIMINYGSDDTIIRGNTIHHCVGDGIHMYAASDTPVSEYSKNVQIVDNILYRGDLQWSEDGIDIKGADGLEVTGNELYGYYNSFPGSGSGIVVQMGSRNLVFDGNVMHDNDRAFFCSPTGGKYPENITIRNNLLYDLDGDWAILLDGIHEAIVYHNTIANATGHAFRITGGGLHGGDIRNNLIYNSGSASISSGTPFDNVTVGYNGWFDTDAESDFTDPTDIVGSGDPGFVDAASSDYHLMADSPACDAGTDVGVTADFEGDARPFGDHPDIGADEYQNWPTLNLTATPDDQTIYLIWTEFEDAALDSYVITYAYGTGGSDASQGPSPIRDIPATTHVYSLTDVANYVFYTVTITARDENDVDLAMSNSVRVMPTNFFVYLPLILKEAP